MEDHGVKLDGIDEKTVLKLEEEGGIFEEVKYLVDKGAKLDDDSKKMLFQRAEKKGYFEIEEYFGKKEMKGI